MVFEVANSVFHSLGVIGKNHISFRGHALVGRYITRAALDFFYILPLERSKIVYSLAQDSMPDPLTESRLHCQKAQ